MYKIDFKETRLIPSCVKGLIGLAQTVQNLSQHNFKSANFVKIPLSTNFSKIMTPLTEDEIEDFLYFARVNELDDLKAQVLQSSRQHNCSDADILKAVADEESGNTALHYSSANGHLGSLCS